mgnify:CR=1 FL=1
MKHLRRFFTSEHEHRLGRLLLKRLREPLTLKEMENEQEKAPVSVHQYIIDIEFRMNHAGLYI